MDEGPLWWPVQRLVDAYRGGSLSPVEVSELAQARIAQVNPTLHAFVLATSELARKQAAAAETAYRSGNAGPLAGVPVSIKDAFHISGHVTTLGCLAHANDVARHDSGAVRRLRRAGAVFVGKTNVSEFCQSATTDNLLGPDTANPFDPRRTADARRLHSVLSADGTGTQDASAGVGPRRIAWCPKPEGRPIDADVGNLVATAVTQLAACGHDVSPTELDLGGWEEIFGPLVLAEEGERRGHLLGGPHELTWYHRRSLVAAEQLDPDVLVAARSALARYRERVDRYFCDYDVIVTPATATTAFELGCRPTAVAGEPVSRLWGAFPFAVPFNVSGHPAVVLPVGFVDGLPVAIQLVGRHGGDAELLSLAEQLETALDVRPLVRLSARWSTS
ncbi:amidase [Candidatus Poriferisodalis sp.]|uniref:amidase n=1 Tax=Candidatus Poriferisodalis sp. TaxID=3101277 RepID=UPI003B52701E